MKKYYSNIGKIILDGLLTFLAVCVPLVAIYEILKIFVKFPFYFLYETRKIYFLCVAVGITAAAVIQLFRFTRVSVLKDSVTVKRLFSKKVYGLGSNYFHEKTESRRGFFSVHTFYRRYLIINDIHKNISVIRLYGFTESGLLSLADNIHENQVELIDSPTKEKMIRDTWDEKMRFEIPVSEIMRLEWKSVRFISLIFAGLMAAVTVILLLVDNSSYNTIKGFAYMLILTVCILEIPFEIFRTVKNSKRCPQYIELVGEHLMIGENHFMVPDVEKAIITSPDRKSNSIYPVQRYIIIKTDIQKYKFWLGSESSMDLETYKIICGYLRYTFIEYPSKLKFSAKWSWLNS